MGRPKLLIPASSLNIHIDAGLRAQLDKTLYSELEERVPHGAYQRFFNLIITQALTFKRLDLAPYLGTDPGAVTVRGDPASIARLIAFLEKKDG